MATGPGLPRSIRRRTATKAGLATGLIVILAAIVGPTILTTTPPPSSTAAAHASASTGPSGVSSTAPSAGPSEQPEAWAELVVPPSQLAAELIPTDADRLGVGPRSAFTLRSLTSATALALAQGLRADPPVALAIERGPSADVAVVRPASPLVAGVRYRFRLEAEDGSLAGSWAFVARAPLHVVATLPGDLATEVPINTGLEVTFDQDGATGVADHWTVEPAIKGRLEPHGRTWAFVPAEPLAPGTIYVVTIKRGVGVEGSSETLERDVSFRFETAMSTGRAPTIRFGRSMLEIRPNMTPAVSIEFDGGDDRDEELPTTVPVEIHRLAGFDAIVAAGRALAGRDAWAIADPRAVVATDGLARVGEVEAFVAGLEGNTVLDIPAELAPGGYVVTIRQPGAPAQVLVQVTDLSAYAVTATKDMVVWANDLGSNAAVEGASVRLADGDALGRTGADGVLRVTTPGDLLGASGPAQVDAEGTVVPATAGLLIVAAPDGRQLLVPLGLPLPWFEQDRGLAYIGGAPDDWWVFLATDRDGYRQTDTIHVYGTIRARADRSVPDGVELRLRAAESSPEAPILRQPVRASARGVFVADIRVEGLPRTEYLLDLFVRDVRVQTLVLRVTEIRKPAYEIAVQTDRHVYVEGDPVKASAAATFYDGTAVVGMDLRFRGFGDAANGTTGRSGDATASLEARADGDEGWSSDEVVVSPVRPEEGRILGLRDVFVLPSRAWLAGVATIADGRIVVEGSLSWADIAELERLRAGSLEMEEADVEGAPIAGGTVQASIIHLVPVRTQVGTTYDFIEKRVVPVYDYDIREVSLGSQALTATADGTFRLSRAAPVPSDRYEIVLTARDPEGRSIRKTVHASLPEVADDAPATSPYFVVRTYCGADPTRTVNVGEPLDFTMFEADGNPVGDGKLLFLVSQLGSLEPRVQAGATFRRTLRNADLPGFAVRAVWLSDAGYATGDATALVDLADKAITVEMQPDRTRYAPGDQVSIDVVTTDSGGRPIAADVVIQGVDEKLYSIGQASDYDPLPDLMAATAPGLRDSYRSHAVPRPIEGEGCGDTGGERENFEDTVAFQRITTDAAGRGVATFKLSDDLTSWRISAVAVSGALDAGRGSVRIPVGLPFFVDAILAPEYLVGDQAVLRVRAFGSSLESDDSVRFMVSAPTLGLAPTELRGQAFDPLRLQLPGMSEGDHDIRIEAEVRRDGVDMRDVLIRRVHVVPSRLETLAVTYEALQPGYVPQGGPGLNAYLITDAGRGRLLRLLHELVSVQSARFDRTAASELARTALIEDFGVPASALSPTGFDASRYERDGIALLPYASTDLFLSARAALVAGPVINAELLGASLDAWATEAASRGSASRERHIVALAGLAGLGHDVLTDLRSFDPSSLTIDEQLWLALGLAANGDEPSARAIERSLLEAHGQRLGPWVRMLGPTMNESLEATSLLMLLAARLGDPLAHEMARYLDEHPSIAVVFPLESVGYALAFLERLPRAPGRFAWTVDGERHETALEPGGSHRLVLTNAQRSGFTLERLEGELAVVTSWAATDAPLPSDPAIRIRRTVTPATEVPEDRLVRVSIVVEFPGQAPGGCYRLTDLLPSGLAPLTSEGMWEGDEEEGTTGNSPYEVVGQRASWCASPDDHTKTYEYTARIVSPGTYLWEPAVIQSQAGPSLGNSTPPMTYTVR